MKIHSTTGPGPLLLTAFFFLFNLACQQALHLEESQEVTQEPHKMTQVQETGNEKVACNYLLWIFISTPETAVNCKSLTVTGNKI